MKVISFLITILLLASCAGKKGHSSASFKVDLAALTGSLSTANGGALLVGHTLDDKFSLSKALSVNDSDLVLELPNGVWEFYLVAWDGGGGPTILEGVTKCSYSGTHTLDGNDTSVTFKLTTSNCALPIPGDSELFSEFTYNNGSWPKVNFHSCLAIDDVANTCSGTGLTQSYRVSLGMDVDAGIAPPPHQLVSGCKTISDTNYLTLPSGDSLGGGFTPTVFFYTSTDCTGPEVVYAFKEGFLRGSDGTGSQYPNYTDSTAGTIIVGGNLDIYFEHNTETPVGAGPNPLQIFGTGADGNLSSFSYVNHLVTNFSPDGRSANIESTTGYNPGDEIMWYVSEFTASSSECGPLRTGEYGFQRIKTVTSGVMLEFYDTIKPNTDLTSGSSVDYTNCKIQVLRVPNIANFAVASTPTLNPYSNGKGGIIAVRVRDKLTFSANISVLNKGTTHPTHNPSMFSDYTNCDDPKNCLPLGKGNGSAPGGGLILIFAREIDFSSNAAAITAGTTNVGAKAGRAMIVTDKIYASGSSVTIDASKFTADGITPTNMGNLDIVNSGTASSVDASIPLGNSFTSSATGTVDAIFSGIGGSATNVGNTYIKDFDGIYKDYFVWESLTQPAGVIDFSYCAIDSSRLNGVSTIDDTSTSGTNLTGSVYFNPTSQLCFD
ncbi:hypothetical protein [Bacteriovorax sp. Seq25_V]|uniref:hypothetical protein n=1 Tax=Bacteriovorax sp. Seq25_V TaxID=1201288 RepID=UPI00038A40CE|nr:hypothetical protein [Bacteriovorax sp. Seq25_V]EQC45550.1 putative lipoprotein [Bacteriovorax sp. Seq25_V]